MANTKLSALTEISTVASGDFVYLLDVSDTTDSSSGSSRKITKANLVTGLNLTDVTDVTASVADVNATTNFEQTLSSTTTVLTVTDGAIDFDIASHDGTNGLKLGGTLIGASAADINATTNFEQTLSSTTSVLTVTDGAIDFDIASHDTVNGLKLGGTLVTATAAELNLLDGITTLSGSNTGDEPASSTTVSGVIEVATAAETTTGTDATRAVSPDGLAGSDYGKRVISVLVFDDATDVSTGNGAGDVFIRIPSVLNGYNLVEVAAQVQTAGTTGTTDIQIHNVTDTADMLSTVITIDSAETDSSTAATAAVINTATDDVATADSLRIDVDAVSTTAPKGLIVELSFQAA